MALRFPTHLKTVQLVVAMALLAALPIAAQQSQPTTQPGTQPATPAPAGEPDPPPSPAAAFDRLMALLTSEAEQFADTGTLPRAHPSIASEFPHELPETRVVQAIIEPQHREPLIDAYIRWQLTSFDPPLPELRERRFAKLLDDLSPLTVNPRADDQLIAMLNRALEAGELIERDQQQINDVLNAMDEQVSKRRTLNTPALELRDWLDQQYEGEGAERILIAFERCKALADAGWPIGPAGAQAERRCTDAARDRAFTDDDRRVVTRAAGRIIGARRVYVQSARIRQNRLEVNFAETAIYDFDVRRWLRRMDGR